MSHLMCFRLSNIYKFNSILSLGVFDSLPNATGVPQRNVWGNVNTVFKTNKNRPNKHKDPKWSKARASKVLKMDLPDFDFRRKAELEQVTPEERRAFFKKEGILPPKQYNEIPFFLASTGTVFDPYVPPEGDGRASILSKEGAKEKMNLVTNKGKSFAAHRRIRKYDDDFTNSKFIDEALGIYIKAHEALARKEEKRLHKLATEKMYPEMVFNTEKKTIHWEFIKSLEPPRITHMRAVEVMSKTNHFAQITVRFHSQQILAVYDRFGRLIHGNPVVAKDVLEYVVFEKYLSTDDHVWRMHAKIIPDWLRHERPSSLLTQVLPKNVEEEADSEETTTAVEAKEEDEEGTVYDSMGRKMKSD